MARYGELFANSRLGTHLTLAAPSTSLQLPPRARPHGPFFWRWPLAVWMPAAC